MPLLQPGGRILQYAKDTYTYVPTAYSTSSSPILDKNFPEHTSSHNNDVLAPSFHLPPIPDAGCPLLP